MNISVVGVGYVGLVAAACFAETGNKVICVDNDAKKIENLKNGQIPIYEPGLTEIVMENEKAGRLVFTTDLKQALDDSTIMFLGVGTPSADDGSADISAVLAVASDIAESMEDYKIIVTKSTVPVGTHKRIAEIIKAQTDVEFDYVSNPEFLKEGAAVEDFMKPDRVIIGTTNPAVRELMKQLYAPFMRKKSRMIYMDPASAEMTKYAANVMLATRISFMNELSSLCDIFGADIENVRQGIGSDTRIGSSFLYAGLGYGGSCFPKDVKALIHMGTEQNCEMTIAQSVQQANYAQHDRFAQKVIDQLKGKDATVAVWGLAFKAQTDDIRESPAIWCVKKFIDAGIKVRAYDPEAMPASEIELDGKIEMAENEYDALDRCDALVILTDWKQFRSPDFTAIAQKLSSPTIFDGRNLYDPIYLAKQGFKYLSIGRP